MARRLTRTDSIDNGDLFVIYKTTSGDYRGASTADTLEFIQNGLTFPNSDAFITQYSAPSSTGFDISITAGSSNVHLILTPTAGFATGAITLPPATSAIDKQEVLVNCTQQVSSLTVNANGATSVTGEPSSLAADDFFRLKYDLPTSTWYRVG